MLLICVDTNIDIFESGQELAGYSMPVMTRDMPKSRREFSSMKWLRYVQEKKIPIGDAFQDYQLAVRQDPIHRTKIPGFRRLLREGTALAKSVMKWDVGRPKYAYLDPESTIVVGEKEFAFGSPVHLPNSRFLVTYDAETCLVVMAHNASYKAGFLGHAFEPVNVADAIEKAVNLLDAETVMLFGGRSNDTMSVTNVCIAEGLIARYGSRLRVTGRDTLRLERKSGTIAMDTETGEPIFPDNSLVYTGIGCHQLRHPLYVLNGRLEPRLARPLSR